MTDRPAEPMGEDQQEQLRQQPPKEGVPAAPDAGVPTAAGGTTTYTTGTLTPGEVGPAKDKPEHEGPVQGEGPVTTPVQAADAGE